MKVNVPFAEEGFRDFVENSCELICCMDQDGKFIYVNRSWREKMGLSQKEACLMNIWSLVHPDHVEKFRNYFEQVKRGESPDPGAVRLETVFIAKGNKFMTAELDNRSILKGNNREFLVMCSFRDISFRKEAEDRITYLTALVEQSDDMIAFKNMDLKVMAANDSYVKFVGSKKVKDILGKDLSEILGIPPDKDPGKFYLQQDKKAQKLKKGKYLLVENIVNLPKYKNRNFLLKKYPIFDPSGNVIGTGDIIRDVTEFKKAQSRLSESEKHFELLVDQMMHGLAVHELICDENGKPADYRFIRVNKKFEEQTGLKSQDVIGRTVLEVLPNTEHSWIERYGKVALTGNPIQFDSYSAHFDRWYRVSSYSPKYMQFVVVVDDITERKKLEEALYLEKAQIEKTLLSVGDGVISTDKEGRIKLMNTAAEKMTGWQLKNASGRKIEAIYKIRDESTKKKLGLGFEKVLKHGSQINGSDHKMLVSKKGKEIYIEDTAAPIKDSQGNITGMVLVFRDSTEKIERQKEIEQLSLHDHLTGLYNRRYMQDSINRLDTSRNLPLCAIYSDINGLKIINDCFGHETGDEQIKKVADTLRCILRSDDIIGRLGGDEFLVLLPKTGEDVAKSIVERITNSFKTTDTDPVAVSLAIGFSLKTDPAQQISDIIKRAEDNMYKDKLKSGKIMRKRMVENILSDINTKYENERIHSKRVTEYCLKTGRAMGLCREELSELKAEAILHDIGKIVIPANIIIKPAELSEEEYELIKRHSEKGYQILKSIDEYAAFAESVLQHHERWDGKGYPDGLKEESILLHSRIINVAEAYEAMTSDRPYKKAMTPKEAIDELKECRGKQFDPEIVDIFIEKVLQYKDQ